jgi:hypothetical protein
VPSAVRSAVPSAVPSAAPQSIASSSEAGSGGGAPSRAVPCTDEGRWGADGVTWVYPPDRELACISCSEIFAFDGRTQAWYAKKGLYPPTR